MSEMKWTKGPWRAYVREIGTCLRDFSGDGGYPLCSSFVRYDAMESMVHAPRSDSTTGRQLSESMAPNANARLIAAAPELYEALDELVAKRLEKSSSPQEADGSDGRYARARAALAKARGET